MLRATGVAAQNQSVKRPPYPGFKSGFQFLSSASPAGTLRLVSNRNMIATSTAASIHSYNCSTTKTAATALTTIQIVHTAYYLDPGSQNTEQHVAGTATYSYQASIEYPVGSGTIVGTALYGGSATGNVASGSTLVSDAFNLSVTVPPGALYTLRVHCYDNNGGGCVYATGITRLSTDNFEYGNSATVDIGSITGGAAYGGSGTSNAGASAWVAPPMVIAVATTQAEIGLGDSILYGLRNPPIEAYFRSGEVFKSYSQTRVFLNLGGTGMLAGPTGVNSFGVGYVERLKLFQYAPYIIYQMGRNNLTAGQSAATIKTAWQSDLAAILTQNATAKITMCTIIPRSSSTDLWTTTTNQTTDTTNSIRVTCNTNITTSAVTGNNNGFFDQNSAIQFGTGLLSISGMTTVTDGILTTGALFTSASYTFVAAPTYPNDNADYIIVNGAGVAGAAYESFIFSLSPPHSATLNTPPNVTAAVAAATSFINPVSQDGQHLTNQSYYAVSLAAVNYALIP